MAMIEGLALDSAPAAGFTDPDSLHRGLARWNRQRLSPGVPRQDWRLEMSRDHRMQLRESEFVEAFRARVTPMVEDVPTDPEGFIAWFEELKNTGPGQWDPLFDWLATEADLEQIRWFLTQEAAGEAGFDDLVAMTQVKLPARPKLELARNYWARLRARERICCTVLVLRVSALTLRIIASSSLRVAPRISATRLRSSLS